MTHCCWEFYFEQQIPFHLRCMAQHGTAGMLEYRCPPRISASSAKLPEESHRFDMPRLSAGAPWTPGNPEVPVRSAQACLSKSPELCDPDSRSQLSQTAGRGLQLHHCIIAVYMTGPVRKLHGLLQPKQQFRGHMLQI